MRCLGHFGIVQDGQHGALCAAAQQRLEHAHGIGIAAGAGIVLGVGDDERARIAIRHGKLYRLVGAEKLFREVALGGFDFIGQTIDRMPHRRRIRAAAID